MQEHEKLRHDVFYLVGDEHLARVELYFIPVYFKLVFEAGKVQYAREVEGIIDVEVDPKQGIFREGVQLLVKRQIVLIFQVGGVFGPQRMRVVHHIVGFYFLFLPVIARYRFFFLAEHDGYGQELAVFPQYLADSVIFEKFLVIIIDVQDHIGAEILPYCRGDLELGAPVAAPARRFTLIPVRFRDDLDLARHHEGGVKTQAEHADDLVFTSLFFVFLDKFGSP